MPITYQVIGVHMTPFARRRQHGTTTLEDRLASEVISYQERIYTTLPTSIAESLKQYNAKLVYLISNQLKELGLDYIAQELIIPEDLISRLLAVESELILSISHQLYILANHLDVTARAATKSIHLLNISSVPYMANPSSDVEQLHYDFVQSEHQTLDTLLRVIADTGMTIHQAIQQLHLQAPDPDEERL